MAFGKKNKYKKVVKTIFPTAGGEMNLQNISKLVYFCEMNPEQLIKVGEYIKKKAEASLKKKRLEYVNTCIVIVRELIVGCRKNMLYFASNATTVMRLLLEQDEHPDLQIEATETFIKFSSVQEDASQYQEYEDFIQYFIKMCKNNDGDQAKRRRIRSKGLDGVRSYISILELIDELDTFITKHRDLISTILDNMQYRDQLPSPEQPERRNTQELAQISNTGNSNNNNNNNNGLQSVKAAANECLRDLSRRVDNITVTSLVETILNYLDSNQKWGDDHFSTECMVAVAESIKPQHYTILLTSYLRHLETQHLPPVTKEIVQTAVAIATDSTVSVNMVVTYFLKTMMISIDTANRTNKEHVGEQFKLQSSIIEAIGAVCKKLKSNRSKMETMILVMSQLKDEQLKGTSSETNVVVILDIVQCVLQVSSTLTDIIPHTILNDLIQHKLLPLAEHSSSEVRIIIQKIFHSLLLPGKTFEQLIQGHIKSDGVDELILEKGTFIRDTLYTSIMSNNNQPENIVVLFKTMVILLYRGKNKELQHSIPMVFKLQKLLTKQKKTLQSSSIHLTIAAYLIMVAKLYNIPNLETYINDILKKRKENNQTCRHLTFDYEKCQLVVKPSTGVERDHPVLNLVEEINQETVADMLCEIPSLNSEVVDLPKILKKKKYNTITRSDLSELNQVDNDSLELASPPVKTIALLGSSDSMLPNATIIDHPKILTFDSFKQFATFTSLDQNDGTSSNTGNANGLGSVRGGSGIGHASNIPHTGSVAGSVNGHGTVRNNITNNSLFTRDLTYQHVVSLCEENSSNMQKEQDLLLRLVLQTDNEYILEGVDEDQVLSTLSLKMKQTVLENNTIFS